MNIQPNAAAASAAGTAHAASKGGETDKQSSEAASRQSIGDKPAGRRHDATAVEGSEPSGDRGGDGRQTYDSFERAEEQQHDDAQQQESQPSASPQPPDGGNHLDVQA